MELGNKEKSRRRRFLAIAIIVLVTTIAYRSIDRSVRDELDTGRQFPVASVDTLASNSESLAESDSDSSGQPTEDTSEPENCLDFTHLESDRRLQSERELLGELATHGNAISSLRGLSRSELAGLVQQGNAAAMAVLGRMAELRALDKDERLAVSSFVGYEDVQAFMQDYRQLSHDLTDVQIAELEKAADWYYRAALNGRILALSQYASAISRIHGDPVSMGLISSEDYDAVTGQQRAGLQFSQLFTEVALDIAPSLRQTHHFEIMAMQIAQFVDYSSPVRQKIRKQLVGKFLADQQAQQLAPINIDHSRLVSFDEIKADFCDEVTDRYFTGGSGRVVREGDTE